MEPAFRGKSARGARGHPAGPAADDAAPLGADHQHFVHGWQGGPANLSHYCATKFGVIGLTQSLAKEVASCNVTVNAVSPGVVRTPLWDDPATGILRQLDGEKGWEMFVSGIPLGRPQTAQDVGHACAYLACGAAANIAGEALNVSGGQQMH
jgi:NAD(P)-dependent dehydrogenase (short-subunit alcohol dehydrogenase family)